MALVFLLDAQAARRRHLAQMLRRAAYEVHAYAHIPEQWNLPEQDTAVLVLADFFLWQPALITHGAAPLLLPEAAALVFFAAQADVQAVRESFRLGAYDFIVGDVATSDALSAIKRVLAKKQQEMDNCRKLACLEQENRALTLQVNALKADQESGHFAQLMLLPSSPYVLGSCQLSHKIIPSLCLSGDFIDYFAIDEARLGFLLADVAGHGVSSAFVTVLLKYVMNSLRNDASAQRQGILLSPAELLKHINHELITMAMGKHVAMIYGVIEWAAQTLEFSVAAHYPLPILKNEGPARFVGGASLPLGLFEGIQAVSYHEKLSDDFSLIMFSDGIMHILPQENLAEKELYLLEMIDKGCHDIDSIASDLQLDGIKAPEDDIGVLVVRGR